MKIVLIHGINQNGKDPSALKNEWLTGIRRGFSVIGKQFNADEHEIVMPFYGDVLADLGTKSSKSRGESTHSDEMPLFISELLISMEEHIRDSEDRNVKKGEALIETDRGKGIHKKGLKQAARVIEHISPLKGRLALRFLRQAHNYIMIPSIRAAVNNIVRTSFEEEEPIIIISHSLGTIVSYLLLLEMSQNKEWKAPVPLFLTMGSPLSLKLVQSHMGINPEPLESVKSWVNITDEEDFIALGNVLDSNYFQMDIKNHTDIENGYEDPHSLDGYISSEPACSALSKIIN